MKCANCECLDKTIDSDGNITYRCFGVKEPFVVPFMYADCAAYNKAYWRAKLNRDKNKGKSNESESNSVTIEFDEKKKYVWHYNSKGELCCENCGFKPTYSLNKDNSIYCPHCGVKLTHDIYTKTTK